MVKAATRATGNRYYSPKPTTWEPEPGERFTVRWTERQRLGPLLVGDTGQWKVIPWHHGLEDLRLGQTWLMEEICHWGAGSGQNAHYGRHHADRETKMTAWGSVIYARPIKLLSEESL